MKFAFFAILALLAVSQARVVTPYEYLEVFDGVLVGMLPEAQIEKVGQCILTEEFQGSLIEEAIDNLMIKEQESQRAGLKKLGDVLSTLPYAMKKCNAYEEDIEKFELTLKAFMIPYTLLYQAKSNLVVNKVDLYDDIETAIAHYQEKQYKLFGLHLGHALREIYYKNEHIPEETFKKYGVTNMKEFQAKFASLELHQPTGFPSGEVLGAELGASLPEEFDSRTQWPDCKPTIRNQLECGSCWAQSSSEVLGHRFCIASNGKVKVPLSPQYQVSCDKQNHDCYGGILPYTWQFLEETGTVSDECDPYVSWRRISYSKPEFYIPACPDSCKDGSALKRYRARIGSVKALQDADQIKAEIYSKGPVQSGYMVFADFMRYQKGEIYERTSYQQVGGHAIKIVGWGQRKIKTWGFFSTTTEYWIVQNSWGTEWGDEGYFLIKTGECNIDQMGFVGDADLSSVKNESFLGY